ncbi:MAG: hypothetical protein AAFN59_14500, partial [Pseudomonadota bacterium]
MTPPSRSNLRVGAVFVVLAVVAIFVWIPLDTDSSIIQKVRGRQTIGDALAPTVAAAFLLLGGLLLVLREGHAREQPVASAAQLW